jgi:hypothetical protein
MKLTREGRVCPETFEGFGPFCLTFVYPIRDIDNLYQWMVDHYGKENAYQRVWYSSDRMISRPVMKAYFDTEADAALFKLTWGGQ